ncbi:MAG TPA: aldose 1-epimerase [Chloroflexota bacterium]
MSGTGPCRVEERVLRRWTRAVVMENDLVRIQVLVDKGADIYELRYKPSDLDVLWKAPWGAKELGSLGASAANSQVAWMDHYWGGWQEIFPSGGGPCVYKGVELGFHGEVSTAPWDYEVLEAADRAVTVRFATATTRTPFRVERVMRLEAGQPSVLLQERVTNEGAEEMAFMWGHHPAYGAPFLSGACVLDIPKARFVADAQTYPDRSWLPDSGAWDWPVVVGRDGRRVDLSRVPGPEARVNNFGYVVDLEEGWYGLTNTDLGLGVGLVWPKEVFPHLWFWQELNSSLGYPWYGRAYVMGLEPWTSYPAGGVTSAIEAGTARTLPPGGSLEAWLRVVFYESRRGVRRIAPDGSVELRQE